MERSKENTGDSEKHFEEIREYSGWQSRPLANTLLYQVYKTARRTVNMTGPDYADELDANFTKHEVQQITLAMKNNKLTGCDNTPAEVQRMLVTKDERTKTLTKLFNTTNL
jgi:hypothetical protein